MSITVRDFAAQMGCGVANVYKHIKQNSVALEGHIGKVGSKQYLDEHAQEFLKSLITPKTLKVEDEVLLEEINKLRALVVDLTQQNNKLIKENAELRVERSKIDSERFLLEHDVNTLKIENESLKKSSDSLKKDLESFKPFVFGLFGLYKKEK